MSIVPLTLKQFQVSEVAGNEDKLIVDGREVTQIRVVGQVQEYTPNGTGTNFTFQLDDGTASAEVKLWIHENPSGLADFHETQKPLWREGIYVEVFGSIKIQQNRRSIFAQRVNVVTDYNAFTHHFLQCIHSHLHAIKSVGGNHLLQVVGGLQIDRYDPYNTVAAKPEPSLNNPYNNASVGGGGNLEEDFKAICAQAPPKGFHIDHIIAKLPQYSAADIHGAIPGLLKSGGIYTTVPESYRS